MKSKLRLSLLWVCFISSSAVVPLAGCTSESSFSNNGDSGKPLAACYGYCDTSGYPPITKENCYAAIAAGATGSWHDDQCHIDLHLVKEKTQCAKLLGIQAQNAFVPYYKRVGITLNQEKGIYSYKVGDDYYCGTYDEIGLDSELPRNDNKREIRCENYIQTHDLGFSSYEAFKAYFEKMTQDFETGEDTQCPPNTLSCFPLRVRTINADFSTLGFCSACAKDAVICPNNDMKCTSITTDQHCGSCTNNCEDQGKICKYVESTSGNKTEKTYQWECVAAFDCPVGTHPGQNGCEINTIEACGQDGNCIEKVKDLGWQVPTDTVEPDDPEYEDYLSRFTGYCGYVKESSNESSLLCHCDLCEALSKEDEKKACVDECLDACIKNFHACVQRIMEQPNYSFKDDKFKTQIIQCFDPSFSPTFDTHVISAQCLAKNCTTGYYLDEVEGKCVKKTQASCTQNQYYLAATGECVENDITNCGFYKYSCKNEVAGWESGKCDKSKCVATKCLKPYVLAEDPELHLSTCILGEGDIDNCEAAGQACKDHIDHWQDGICKNNQCIVTACQEGYHLATSDTSPDKPFCVENSPNACAPVTSQTPVDCTEAFQDQPNIVEITCDSGQCKISKCAPGHHLFDKSAEACTKNSAEACAPVDAFSTQTCDETNPVCNEAGTCCRESKPLVSVGKPITTRPTCCQEDACRQSSVPMGGYNQTIYICTNEDGAPWTPCTP